jgi:hypothetical protein
MVQLYEYRGSTSTFIDAEINESWDLVISGQDVGEAPRVMWGDSDYEWWVVVKAEHKDKVLLALIEQVFGGTDRSADEFRAWLTEKGIPSEFGNYM